MISGQRFVGAQEGLAAPTASWEAVSRGEEGMLEGEGGEWASAPEDGAGRDPGEYPIHGQATSRLLPRCPEDTPARRKKHHTHQSKSKGKTSTGSHVLSPRSRAGSGQAAGPSLLATGRLRQVEAG